MPRPSGGMDPSAFSRRECKCRLISDHSVIPGIDIDTVGESVTLCCSLAFIELAFAFVQLASHHACTCGCACTPGTI